MKKRILPFGFFSLWILGLMAFFVFSSEKIAGEKNQTNRAAQTIEGSKQYFAAIRNNQHTGLLNPADVIKAREQKAAIATTKSGGKENWVELGPDNIGGRTRAILYDNRDASGATLYAGSVTGGVFKSTNSGALWNKVNLNSGTANLNVTCMVQTDNGTIFAGTGEGFNSNEYTGTNDYGYEGGFMGKGLFKSDANDDFTLVAGTAPQLVDEVYEWAYINDLALDNTNNRLFVATNAGLRNASLPGLSDWNSTYKYRIDSSIVTRAISIDSVLICDSVYINPETNLVDTIWGSMGWNEYILSNDTSGVETIYQDYVEFETQDNCSDVKVSTDGWVAAVFNNKIYVSADGSVDKFVCRSVYPDNDESVRMDEITWNANIQILNHSGQVLYTASNTIEESTNWHTDYKYGEGSMFEGFPSSDGAGRTEFAMAPSDPATVYAQVAKGSNPSKNSLMGIYVSNDMGNTWRIAGPGGSPSLNILGDFYGDNETAYYQGDYCNAITVFPNNAAKILAGGINLWYGFEGSVSGFYQWSEKSISTSTLLANGIYSQYYLHKDHHVYAFNPANPNKFMVGTDGGIFQGTLSGDNFAFQSLNKNYNSSQFYSLDISSRKTEFIGGTQDNGTVYVSGTGSSTKNGEDIWRIANLDSRYPAGTDGGSVAFSNIRIETSTDEVAPPSFYSRSEKPENDDLIDRMRRSETLGYDYATSFLSSDISTTGFIAPMLLWESYDNANSRDSITIYATADLMEGDTLTIFSENYGHPFHYFLPNDLPAGDSMMIQDRVSTKLFIATDDEIWMTLESIRFDLTPEWFKISSHQAAGFEDMPLCMALSADANYLYVGTETGRLFRISNIALAYNNDLADVESANCIIATNELTIVEDNTQAVTGISVDPKDPNKVLVTLGNYGNEEYVYFTDNALANEPVFTSVQGNLPQMPVYSCLLEMDAETDMAYVGTEMGLYMTEDVTSGSWTMASSDIGEIPVMAIKQQDVYKRSFTFTVYDPVTNEPFYTLFPEVKNYGDIYIATHGRGVFMLDLNYVGIEDKLIAGNESGSIQLSTYPNPAVDILNIDFNLQENTSVQVMVYDLSGKLVGSNDFGKQLRGENKLDLNISNLEEGTYIVQLIAGSKSNTEKILVVK